ncbi:PopZ family protein [Aurantimonas sp. A2-1-M11]|uniref:PopZ family protein n=1 Tax=Aurantimonas sp. A2-1-M11 TaxID=3113712 RepID=UPI003FA5A6C7
MSNALPAREPSMDEILASIRRIIESGEEKSPSRRSAARQAAAVARPDEAPATALESAESGDVRHAQDVPAEPLAEMRTSVGGDCGDVSGFDAVGRPANDTTRTTPRPKLGLVSPAAPRRDEPVEDVVSTGSGDVLSRIEDENAPAGELAAAPAEIGGEPSEHESYSADVTALSSARLQAASLAAASERRVETVRQAAADDMARAVIAESTGDDRVIPTNAGLEMADAESSEPLASVALGSVSAAVVGDPGPSEDTADFLGEFDEEEFASELLDRALADEHSEPDVGSLQDEDGADSSEAALDAAAGQRSAAGAGAMPAAVATDTATLPASVAASLPSAVDIHALVSQEAGERIAGSFDDLARVIRDEQMRTMDETVREMLRPMLHEWLDDNLPRLVERLVREEIERVARGGRR